MAHFCDLKEFKENSSFTGVVPIYKPAGRARGRIFAIPGEEFETWHTAWTQGEVFWLRDFLPKQFPHCAIYSVSYIETTQRIQNPNVYQDMHDFMQQTPIRERAPVALIAHRDAGEAVDAVIRNVWGTEGDKYSLRTSTPRRDVLAGVVFLGMSDKTYPVAYKNLIEAGPTHDLDDKTWLVRKDQPKILFKDYDLLPDRDNTNSATSAFPPIPPFLEEGNQDYKTTCECLQEVFRNFLPVDRTFHRERFEMQLQTPALDESSMDPYDLWPSHNRTYWKLPLKPTSHPHLWVHLPANNQQSMSLSRQQIIGDEYEIVESGVWGSIGTVIEARSKAAHSRYVLPKFELMRQFGLQIWQHTEGQHTQACNVTQVHVALPYLHWDTLSSAIDYKRAVSSLRLPSRHTTQDGDPQGLLQLVRHDPDTYHPRRTLDQFYFSHAKNTDERDRDQVVSKQTLNDGSPGGQKMIMVDQIWLRLWIVEITEWQAMVCASSRLLTAFPHTSYARSDKDFPGLFDLADVLQMAVGDLEAGLRHNQTPDDDYTARQAAAILSRAVLGTLSIGHRNTSSAQQQKPNEALDKARQSLMFLELFREAIGQATDQYNSLFRKFEERIRLKGKSASEQSNLESDASAEEAVLEPSTETRNGDTGATNQSTAPGIVEGGTGSPQPPPAPGTVENTTGIQRPQPAPGVVENGTVSPMPQPAPEPGATATGDREDARSTLAAMKASRKNRKRNKVQLASVTEKADQMKLAIEIEDILDELHMLEQLFNIQQTVLSRGIAESDRVDCLKPLHNGMYHIAHEIETEYLPQVTRMIKDSERLRQSLYNLLDLEQKEESLNEAQRANQQALFAAKQALSSQDSADAAQAQSLILFVFTVVTIVFAPLSFFTSFFQLYSVEKNPDADSLAYRPDYVQKVMWGFSGTFYFSALAGAAAFIWYQTKSSRAERTKELLHLDLKNNLPPDLLDEEDSENERMEEMYPKYLEERSEKRKKADEKAKKKEEKEAKKKAKQEAKKKAKQAAEERKKRGNEASRTRAEPPPATTSERTTTPKPTEQQGGSPATSSTQGDGPVTGTGGSQGQATENTANLAASTQETAPVSSPAATNSAKTDRSSTDSRRRAVSKRTAPADVEDAFSADSYGSG